MEHTIIPLHDWVARLWDGRATFVWQHANTIAHPVGWEGEDSCLPHNVWLYVEYGSIAGEFGTGSVYLPRGTAAWLPAGTRRCIHCDGGKDALTRRIVFDVFDDNGRQLLFTEAPLVLHGASSQIAYHQLLMRGCPQAIMSDHLSAETTSCLFSRFLTRKSLTAGLDNMLECKALVTALVSNCAGHRPMPPTSFRTFSHVE